MSWVTPTLIFLVSTGMGIMLSRIGAPLWIALVFALALTCALSLAYNWPAKDGTKEPTNKEAIHED